MKRAIVRCMLRYSHVAVTLLIVTLLLYVVIMDRVTFTTNNAVTVADGVTFARMGVRPDLYKLSDSHLPRGPKSLWRDNSTLVTFTDINRKVSAFLAGVPRSYKGYLTIGIPTLKRPKGEYFFATLASLLQQSTPGQQRNTTYVVMLADREARNNDVILAQIKAKYHLELSKGLILVVSAPDTEHIFRARDLKRTFNDSLERVRWRSKQNLDYAALMEISANLSTYYLQIEDDVTAAPNYLQHIRTFVTDNSRKPWAGLEVCPHGFIGKLFRSEDLPKLYSILRTFYLEMPCDFLINHFYKLMLQNKVIRRKGNLFFHQGKFSSLANVTRKTDRRGPGQQAAWAPVVKKHAGHHNPQAVLYTTIAVYSNFRIKAAYNLSTGNFFWGKDVKDGDDITVVFSRPQPVERIVVESGIMDKTGHRRDFIRNGTVEFGDRAYIDQQGRKALCTDTHELGSFVHGRFNQSLPATSSGHVQCFTLVITQAQKEWVAIPEIVVFLREQ